MQLNIYFLFVFFFLLYSYNKFINKIRTCEQTLQHRPHTEVLSCPIRGRCESLNAPPQRHTTTINSIKTQVKNPIVSPRWRTHSTTHTHTRTREVKGESKTDKFEFGKKKLKFFFSLYDHGVDSQYGRLPLRCKTERKLIQKILRIFCIRENLL